MAIQISIQDKKAIERAIARCKAEHPTVRAISALKYEVTSSKDKTQRYTVTWSGKGAAMVADCNCKAGSKGQVCKHVVACAGLMKAKVRERAAARSCIEEGCTGIAAEGETLCGDHIELEETSRMLHQAQQAKPVHKCTECKVAIVTIEGTMCKPCYSKLEAELFG